MHVVFEITKDADLLKQYFELREKTFKKVLGLREFDGSKDVHDEQADILIARIDDCVIGGVRIYGNHYQQQIPLEQLTSELTSQLPNLSLATNGYCQWMRLTLTAETSIPFNELHREFSLALAHFSNKLGYRYAFCVSSKIHQRLYKRLFSNHGYNHWGCENVTIASEEEFDDLEHLLSVTDLSCNNEPQERMSLQASYHLNSLNLEPVCLT